MAAHVETRLTRWMRRFPLTECRSLSAAVGKRLPQWLSVGPPFFVLISAVGKVGAWSNPPSRTYGHESEKKKKTKSIVPPAVRVAASDTDTPTPPENIDVEQWGFFTAALYQIIDSEVAAFSFAQIIDDFRRSYLAPNFTGHY